MIVTEQNVKSVLDAIDGGNYTLKHIKLALPTMWTERINGALKILVKEGTIIRFRVGQEAAYCRPSSIEDIAHLYRYSTKTFVRKFCEGIECQ